MKKGMIDTILGKIIVMQDGEFITRVMINDNVECEHYDINTIKSKRNDEITLLETTLLQIYEYIYEGRKSFTIPICAKGSNFQKSVWEELKNISYGETISYKELAKRIGKDRSFRAVGNANGKNPLPILVPCHRVVKSDGSLGGYSLGISIKENLLAIEDKNK